jgi:DNA-binding IclR family transcriptional regulator
MKTLIHVVTAAALAIPSTLVLAQTTNNSTTTRGEVRQQLQSVEHNGYSPSTGAQQHYPADINAAQQRAQGKNPGMNGGANSGYGSPASGNSQSGSN